MIRKVIIFLFLGFFLYTLLLYTRRETAQAYDVYDAVSISGSWLFEDNAPDSYPSVRRLREEENTITKKIDFKPPAFSKTTINGTQYDRVRIDGLENVGNPGEPVLPMKVLKIFIPLNKRVTGTKVVYEGKTRLTGTYHIEPGQEEAPLDDFYNIVTTKPNQAIYGSNEPFPNRVLKLITTQTLYKSEIYIFNLFPVEYLPKKGQVSYYKSLTLILNLESKPKNGQGPLSDLILSGYFRPSQYNAYEARIRGFVDNPNTVSTPSFNSDLSRKRHYRDLSPRGKYEYLIITDQDFEGFFKPLIDSKINKGLTARVETTQSIYQNYDGERPDGDIDDQTKIREFIKDAHIQWGTQYVLLGGDTDIIPCRLLWDTSTPIASDIYYACLDGTFDHNKNGIYGEMGDGEEGGEVDLLAEVYIGRAPVSTMVEVLNFVRKTLMHERLPIISWKNLMVGEYLGFLGYTNTYAKPYMEEIKLGSNAHGYSTKGIEASSIETHLLYDADNEWEKQTLIGLMNNENIHFYNHMGHSVLDENMKLTIDDVETLINPIPFFVYSQGCYAASFDNIDEDGNLQQYDSIAEHFVNTTFGAFAYIGNTRSGWYDHSSTNGCSQRFHRHFWDCIITEGIRKLGMVNQISKEKNIGLIESEKNRWCYFQITLLGDPEISIGDFEIPTGDCIFSISPKERSFDYTGGSASIDVTSESGCPWRALTDSAWIKIESGEQGSGTGTIDYEVLENTSSSDRTGQITIEDENNNVKASFRVDQEAYIPPSCSYSISPTSRDFESSGGEGSFRVITEGGCFWQALSDSAWINIASIKKSESNIWTINYIVLKNTARSDRKGQITIKDENNQVQALFRVNQKAFIPIIKPENPIIVGSCNTKSSALGVYIQGSYAFVADAGSGLLVIDITNPKYPVIAGSCDTPGKALGVHVQGSYAFVADGDSGLQVIDITNPKYPVIVGSCNTPDFASDIHVQGSYAYMADNRSGLQVIDITSPKHPAIVGSCSTPGWAYGVHVQGSYAYVADWEGSIEMPGVQLTMEAGLQVIDISDPQRPAIMGSCDTPGYAYDVYVQGSYAYVADEQPHVAPAPARGFQVIDITNPIHPVIVGSCNTPDYASGIYVQGSYAYVADGGSGLQVIDITNPKYPAILSSCDTPGSAGSVHIQGSYAYVADRGSGLQVIDIANP